MRQRKGGCDEICGEAARGAQGNARAVEVGAEGKNGHPAPMILERHPDIQGLSPSEKLVLVTEFEFLGYRFTARREEWENAALCQGQEQEEAERKPQATHPRKQWGEPAGDHRGDQRDPGERFQPAPTSSGFPVCSNGYSSI